MENIKEEVTVRNIEDDLSYIKDRGSWTQTLSRKSGKMIERLLRSKSNDSPVKEDVLDLQQDSPRKMSHSTRDSEASIDEQIEKFEKTLKATEKRNARLRELVETEEGYNEDLRKFKAYFELSNKTMDKGFEIQMPTKLRDGRHRIAFSNVEHIFTLHAQDLLPKLREQRDSEYDAGKILNLFKNLSKDMKAFYGRYSIHSAMAALIISQNEEFFRKLKDFLKFEHRLSDLIMRPIQRLTQYELIFHELMQACKEADKPEETEIFQECIKIANDISQKTNAMVKAGRIEDFEGDITKQGELIMEEGAESLSSRKPTLFRLEQSSKIRQNIHIFLFAQSVIVCHVRTRRATTGVEVKRYLFWHKFSINNMQVRDIARGGNELEFEMHDTNDTEFGGLTIAVQSIEKKNFIVKNVTQEIRKLDFYKKSLVNPVYLSFNSEPQ